MKRSYVSKILISIIFKMISSQEPCFKDINLCFHCYHLQVHNININLYNRMTLSFLLLKKNREKSSYSQ